MEYLRNEIISLSWPHRCHSPLNVGFVYHEASCTSNLLDLYITCVALSILCVPILNTLMHPPSLLPPPPPPPDPRRRISHTRVAGCGFYFVNVASWEFEILYGISIIWEANYILTVIKFPWIARSRFPCETFPARMHRTRVITRE